MTYFDATIIYLAIGSPLAVYYFLRGGREYSVRDLPMAVLAMLLWPIYTIWLAAYSNGSGPSKSLHSPNYVTLDAATSQRVDKIRQSMEKIVCERIPERSVFDFREVFERYVGLTGAIGENEEAESNRFSHLTGGSVEGDRLNAICLNRRNHRLLEFHHIRARNDFLALAANIRKCGQEVAFDLLTVELCSLIADQEAMETVQIESGQPWQTEKDSSVVKIEGEIWTAKPQRSAIGRL
jgi:hypothetical protein